MRKRVLKLGTAIAASAILCLGMAGCGNSNDIYSGLNLDDYIKVGEYKGLSVAPVEVKVSKEDVQAKIDEALSAAATEKELGEKEKIKEGDTANIDFSGKIDGKEFEGGTSTGFDLTIGSGSFIEGFEDGLIGKHAGEKVSLDLKFPDDYQGKEVAGKDVTFDVTINSVKRTNTPEYNDDFIKKNTEYDNKKDYEASLKKSIKKEKKEEAESSQKNQLWSQVMENTEMIKYPEDIVKTYVDNFNAQIDKTAEQAGMQRSEVLSQYYGITDEKELDKMLEESAQTLIQQEMAIEYIADKEDLSYSNKEKEAKVEEYKTMGYDEETIQEQTGRTMDEYVHITLLYDKVLDFILDNAKIDENADAHEGHDHEGHDHEGHDHEGHDHEGEETEATEATEKTDQ